MSVNSNDDNEDNNGIQNTEEEDPIRTQIREKVLLGDDVFFTGAAGTGKTRLLKEIIDLLIFKHGRSRVAVTAPTGIAASHIEGTTLNAALGIGVPRKIGDVYNSMMTNRRIVNKLSVLVIDECSMLSGELFQEITEALDMISDKKVQLIICGDFYQLPPVPTRGSAPESTTILTSDQFAFEAPVWAKRFSDSSFQLTKVYRQDDPVFVSLLNRIRVGDDARGAMAELVRTCGRKVDCGQGVEPTRVLPTNSEIQEVNDTELFKLESESVKFEAQDSVTFQGRRRGDENNERLFRDFQAQGRLELKIGAQVGVCRPIPDIFTQLTQSLQHMYLTNQSSNSHPYLTNQPSNPTCILKAII